MVLHDRPGHALGILLCPTMSLTSLASTTTTATIANITSTVASTTRAAITASFTALSACATRLSTEPADYFRRHHVHPVH